MPEIRLKLYKSEELAAWLNSARSICQLVRGMASHNWFDHGLAKERSELPLPTHTNANVRCQADVSCPPWMRPISARTATGESMKCQMDCSCGAISTAYSMLDM